MGKRWIADRSPRGYKSSHAANGTYSAGGFGPYVSKASRKGQDVKVHRDAEAVDQAVRLLAGAGMSVATVEVSAKVAVTQSIGPKPTKEQRRRAELKAAAAAVRAREASAKMERQMNDLLKGL